MLAVLLLLLAVAALAWRPRGRAALIVGAAAVAVALGTGVAGSPDVGEAVRTAAPLTLFLAAVLWLAAVAERAGLAERLAAALHRAARGRRAAVYAGACALCALLTATVSLDGAVVLMVPLLAALTRRDEALRTPLLLGTVAVANAFSLALPQGNPTNLVVMQRVGLSPGAFIAHLFVPALLATLVCAAAPALAARRALRARPPADSRAHAHAAASAAPFSRGERGAAALLVVAGVAGAVAPWAGVAPWWAPCGVAVAGLAGARVAGVPVPAVPVPWRIGAQVGILVVLAGGLPGSLAVPATASLAAMLVVGLGVAAVAGVANNLPASVALAGVLGAPGLSAYAALTGLSVGALATPHGSVATLIAFDRAGGPPSAARHVRLLAPAALLASVTAITAVWALAG